ncbi:sensor histidine kinase [Fodinicola feengrottensis]|uniref:hypothetical protein n=1 Tax=Fodinicola feengrottensis TaxID=435914 RepID=UPI0013D6578B|nr:hypothetical protein [Fodinicola feengrottensis]
MLRQVDDPESNQPQPGLSRLDALVAGVSAAGLPTTIATTGQPPSTLPPAVDLAAYRIVQEALTNSIRHAGPATATVQSRSTTTNARSACKSATQDADRHPPLQLAVMA